MIDEFSRRDNVDQRLSSFFFQLFAEIHFECFRQRSTSTTDLSLFNNTRNVVFIVTNIDRCSTTTRRSRSKSSRINKNFCRRSSRTLFSNRIISNVSRFLLAHLIRCLNQCWINKTDEQIDRDFCRSEEILAGVQSYFQYVFFDRFTFHHLICRTR